MIRTPSRLGARPVVFCSLLSVSMAAMAQSVSPAPTPVNGKSGDDFKTSVALGFDRSTGKFGASQKTDITYVPVTLKAENRDVVLKLSVPYIEITGPANVIGGGGSPIVTRGTAANSARRSASGLGDVVAAVSLNLGRNPAGYGLDLTGKVKFPTADEKQGLGTGERDYFLQFDGYAVVGTATLFGTVGRKKMGDTATIDFRDTTYVSAGAGFALNKKTQLGLIYDQRQSSVAGVESQKEATVFLSRQLDRDYRLQAYLVGGLTNTSVDSAVGLQLARAID